MDAPIGRLRWRREFLRVARGRRKWAAPGLVLQARDGVSDSVEARIGFTASRKVGNAVARNRAKRRLRAAVSEVMPACAEPGIDYVIIARGATLTRRYDDLVADLKTALRRLGALRSDRRQDRGHD